MKLSCLFAGARSAVALLDDGGLYETQAPVALKLNGQSAGVARTAVHSLFHLLPGTEYVLEAGGEQLRLQTAEESLTLNARRFGAAGDGVHDDTAAIQAAICCCPEGGRVLIPKGVYRVGALFLKSHLRLEIAEGAALKLHTDRAALPILPGRTERTDETDEWYLGSWEGNPLDMYAALLTGVDAEDIVVYGQGVIDGQGDKGDWWQSPKTRRGAWRGRLLFLNRCKDVTVQGVTFQNSPSWHVHPCFSQRLRFYNIAVKAPAASPNTDGFNPESCRDVALAGAYISVGDDCVALKSGKLYLGRKLKTPCRDIRISHCLMENGHGGVTIGSEMAGGVRDVTVQKCAMRCTDRGLRVKTRRGRGKDGVVDNILFEDVKMEGVNAPFTVNALYCCDPDGHDAYVQSREKQPVDDGTPAIGRIAFRRVTAEGCGACAGYVLGLPEKPVREIRLEDVSFAFAREPKEMAPVMADGVPPARGRGLIVKNAECLCCRRVTLAGGAGEALETENIGRTEWMESGTLR